MPFCARVYMRVRAHVRACMSVHLGSCMCITWTCVYGCSRTLHKQVIGVRLRDDTSLSVVQTTTTEQRAAVLARRLEMLLLKLTDCLSDECCDAANGCRLEAGPRVSLADNRSVRRGRHCDFNYVTSVTKSA